MAEAEPFVWTHARGEFHLISTRSRYVVGRVFPSPGAMGYWSWSVEHVGSGAWGEGRVKTPAGAKRKAKAWVLARRAEETPR